MNSALGQKRARLIIAGMFMVSLIFLMRLFYLQVIDDSFKSLAESNTLRKKTIYPSRGLIYDKNNKLLVSNIPRYEITVVPKEIKNLDTLKLCNLLDIDLQYFNEKIRKAKRYSPYKASSFLGQIEPEKFSSIQEYLYQFPGFSAELRTVRSYPYKNAPHIIGYISEINKSQLDTSEYYRPGDIIGASGIEAAYEYELRGRKGEELVVVDVLNREIDSFKEGIHNTPVEAGKDLHLTIDIDLQQYAEQLLAGKKGSVIAINPQSGEILTMASSPFYDPNVLTKKNRGEEYGNLINDKGKPLFNRSLMAKYPPGSTMKPLVALIAMQEGIIHENFYQYCGGKYRLNKLVLKCSHSHSSAHNIQKGLEESCNPYFWQIFKNTIEHNRFGNPENALNKWVDYLNHFRLGNLTNIDMINEIKGDIPSSKMYDKMYGKNRWRASTIISLGIGQGEFALTPLEIANYCAIVANKGTYHYPHLVNTADMSSADKDKYTQAIDVPIDKAHFEPIIEGMELMIKRKNAWSCYVKGLDICGKTGTAQNPGGEDHSIFMGFAPKYKPTIALAIVIENGGFGSTVAAPMGSLLIEKYFNDSIQPNRRYLEKNLPNLRIEETE